MTVLCTADLHFSENPRDSYRFAAMKTIRGIIKQYGVKVLLILGDLTENKDRHNADLVNRVVGEFVKFAQLCQVVVLTGNHDWYRDAENPFFRFLGAVVGIQWVRTPTSAQNLPIPPLLEIGPSFFLPHTPRPERDWKSIDLRPYKWVFAHQCFDGARTAFGRRLSGTAIDIFPQGIRVVAGDIHVPQVLGPVTYVGAPYLIDYGDDYQPRVLLINRNQQLKSIPCTGPQKRLLTIQSVRQLSTDGLSLGDILKVRVHFEPGGRDSWQEIRGEIQEWGRRHGFVIDAIQPIVDARQIRTAVRRLPRSDQDLLQQYAKSRRINDALLRTGLWLLDHA